jgi:hypothetical protein
VEGDTVALRGAYNKGTYGANFGLSFTGNGTQANFWTPDRIYASEASLWANLLDSKLGVKAGYFGDFDYFSPVNAWNLTGLYPTNAVQVTVYPITGLRIDVRTKNSPQNFPGWAAPVWYDAEEWAGNIDGGIKYSNSTFTAFVALDNDYSAVPFGRANQWQTDAFAHFAFTGVPKLTLSVESKFIDLLSARDDASGDAVGITNVTGVQVGYQITDAFFARANFILGADDMGISGESHELLGADGFSFVVDIEGSYKLNDLTFSLRPIFLLPNTEDAGAFNISVKPKIAWTIAPMTTINFWYMLRYYGDGGDNGTAAYASNDNENLNHSVALTFNWAF